MGLNLSDNELDAMDGLPHFHRCLYIFGIRRYMDYQTGITGIKRKISYKSLSEELYITPHQGFKDSGAKSVAQLKRAIKVLEKSGLVTIHSKVTKTEKQLILKCALARWDKSVQNKPVPMPYHSPVPEADPMGETLENQEIPYKNRDEMVLGNPAAESKTHTETRTTQNEKAVPHPVSGINTKLNYTVLPVDNFLSVEENKFINLFTDLKLSVKPLGDLKAITTAKALVQAGVSIEVASDALKIKLAAYQGDRTPHPSYFKQAILDYKHDLDAIKQQPEDNHATHRPRKQQSTQNSGLRAALSELPDKWEDED